MSDVMLIGVLRMPYELAMQSELQGRQAWAHANEAADRIESDAKRIAALEKLVAELPDKIMRNVVGSMCRTAVNCGRYSSRAVAGWYQDSLDKQNAKKPSP